MQMLLSGGAGLLLGVLAALLCMPSAHAQTPVSGAIAVAYLALQMIVQGKNWKCVDKRSLGISAAAAFFGPGLLTMTRAALSTTFRTALGLTKNDLVVLQTMTVITSTALKKRMTGRADQSCECST